MSIRQPKYQMGQVFIFDEEIIVSHRKHVVTSSGVVTSIIAESTDSDFEYYYDLSVEFPQAYYAPPKIKSKIRENLLGRDYKLVGEST